MNETDACRLYNSYHHMFVSKYQQHLRNQYCIVFLDETAKCYIEVDLRYRDCVKILSNAGLFYDDLNQELLAVSSGKIGLVVVTSIAGRRHTYQVHVFQVYQSDLTRADFVLSPRVPTSRQISEQEKELQEYASMAAFKSLVFVWMRTQPLQLHEVIHVIFSDLAPPLFTGTKLKKAMKYIGSEKAVSKVLEEYLKNENKQMILLTKETTHHVLFM